MLEIRSFIRKRRLLWPRWICTSNYESDGAKWMIIDANCHWLWHLRRDVIEVSTWHAAEYYIYIFSSPLTSYIRQIIKKVTYWSSKAKTYASYLNDDQEEEKTARLCLRLFRNLCTQKGYLLRFYEETSDSEAVGELPQQVRILVNQW